MTKKRGRLKIYFLRWPFSIVRGGGFWEIRFLKALSVARVDDIGSCNNFWGFYPLLSRFFGQIVSESQ